MGCDEDVLSPVQGPPMGPRGSEGLGLLEAEHQPLSSDGGRAFYASHYHEQRCAVVDTSVVASQQWPLP